MALLLLKPLTLLTSISLSYTLNANGAVLIFDFETTVIVLRTRIIILSLQNEQHQVNDNIDDDYDDDNNTSNNINNHNIDNNGHNNSNNNDNNNNNMMMIIKAVIIKMTI